MIVAPPSSGPAKTNPRGSTVTCRPVANPGLRRKLGKLESAVVVASGAPLFSPLKKLSPPCGSPVLQKCSASL